MPQIKMNVTKLGDPTVNFISLVNRGANRIPFRIVKHDKQESNMIDLANLNISKLLKQDKAAEVSAPTIVGFVTMKDENFEAVKDGLKNAGFMVSKQFEEADGSVVFKQDDTMPEEFTVLKMCGSLLALVDGLDTDDLVGGTIYESLLKEDSFLPSPDIATEGMALAMGEIAASQDTPQDKVAKMELVTKDHNGYLTKLFSWVPARLTQLAKELEANIADHKIISGSTTGEVQNPDGNKTTTGIDTGGKDGVEAKGTPAPSPFPGEIDKGKTDPIPAKVTKTADEVAADEAAEGDKTVDPMVALVSKMETMLASLQETMQQNITKQSEEIAEQISAVAQSVEVLKQSQDVLSDRVVAAEKVAKSADSAVRGRMITSDVGDDAVHTTQKSDVSSDGFGGCIDTAFQSTVRKTALSARQRPANR